MKLSKIREAKKKKRKKNFNSVLAVVSSMFDQNGAPLLPPFPGTMRNPSLSKKSRSSGKAQTCRPGWKPKQTFGRRATGSASGRPRWTPAWPRTGARPATAIPPAPPSPLSPRRRSQCSWWAPNAASDRCKMQHCSFPSFLFLFSFSFYTFILTVIHLFTYIFIICISSCKSIYCRLLYSFLLCF